MYLSQFLYPLIFFTGAAFGSFLGVLIDRIPRGENVLSSRSKCNNCDKKLYWYELIPIISYFFLKGKCAKCKVDIPSSLIFYEIFIGLMFLGLVIYFNNLEFSPILILLYLFIFSSLFVIFFIDIKYGIIPDQLLITIFLFSLIINILSSQDLISRFFISILCFLFFFFLFSITRGKGMGFGDVKFSFIIGFLLGFPGSIIAFYISFLTGAIISLILVLIGKKNLRKDTVPFAPFLIIGLVVAFFFSAKILNFLNFF